MFGPGTGLVGPDSTRASFGQTFKPKRRFWTQTKFDALEPVTTFVGTRQALCCFVLFPQKLFLSRLTARRFDNAYCC